MKHFNIYRFKCFHNVSVPINKLTVLCGTNGSGKSSIVQAILLYRAGVRELNKGIVRLNGIFGLTLGSVGGVLCQTSDDAEILSDEIRFGFAGDDGWADNLVLNAADDESEARQLRILNHPTSPILNQKTKFSFIYLSAERIGPRLAQERFSDEEIGNQPIGTKGQFTAECLGARERIKIRDALHHSFGGVKPAHVLLMTAVEHWLSTIVGPIEIRVMANGNAPPSLYFKRPGVKNDWVISTNTGFGITYALPIIVAGLLMENNGVLIVDGPEAHLHPAGQTAVARFLSWVASSGVTVIVETHSDHIIDGIRLATLQKDIPLSPDECTIINVQKEDAEKPQIQTLNIKPDGTLSSWPKGFFDQQTKNFRAIADAVRAKRAQ